MKLDRNENKVFSLLRGDYDSAVDKEEIDDYKSDSGNAADSEGTGKKGKRRGKKAAKTSIAK